MSFENEFKIFRANLHQAARSFYYHREIQSQIYADGLESEKSGKYFQESKIFQAIEANAGFWNDYRLASIAHAIIILGRIFDANKNSHGLRQLIKVARKSKLFTREQLRERKMSGSPDAADWIDSYMERVAEFNRNDYLIFRRYCRKTQILWDGVKAVRNKIYAHQDVMPHEKRSKILEDATYDKFEEILNMLFIIEHAFFDAFYNGSRPNYQFTSNEKSFVRRDVRELLQRLSQ